MIVVASDEQDQKHRNVLGDGDSGPDVRYDIVAVVRAKNHSAVGEEEVARRGVDEVDDV